MTDETMDCVASVGASARNRIESHFRHRFQELRRESGGDCHFGRSIQFQYGIRDFNVVCYQTCSIIACHRNNTRRGLNSFCCYKNEKRSINCDEKPIIFLFTFYSMFAYTLLTKRHKPIHTRSYPCNNNVVQPTTSSKFQNPILPTSICVVRCADIIHVCASSKKIEMSDDGAANTMGILFCWYFMNDMWSILD